MSLKYLKIYEASTTEKFMKSQASTKKTVINVDLNIKTIEWAEALGLDLSEMANQPLKAEVTEHSRKIKAKQAAAAIPA